MGAGDFHSFNFDRLFISFIIVIIIIVDGNFIGSEEYNRVFLRQFDWLFLLLLLLLYFANS
jgi:hypothetical protein